ncbi:YdeI/OmpD-associated family protein [Methylorubrum extorquens]
MITHKGLPILTPPTQAAWNDWLSGQGTSSPGAWLKFAKKGSGRTTLRKPEAIEMALADGWIDGQLDRFDDQFWLVRYTRRGPRSRRSQVNRDIATRLLAEGRMPPAGRAAVEAARRDGR